MNISILVGNLYKDPELRYIPGSGQAVCKFGIAVSKGLSKDKEEEFKTQGKPTADFINIVVWGKTAENCANYLSKGSKVAIEGSIQTGSYDDKDGKKVYTTDVLARSVEFLNKLNSSEKPNSSVEGLPDGFQPIDDDLIPF